MARARILSSFLVTVAVLTLVVGFSLRRDGNEARAQAPAGPTTTLVRYHPVATLAGQETATVYVVNVGHDPDAAPEHFTIIFEDLKGNQLAPEQTCDVLAGQTCTASFLCPGGKGKNGNGGCVFRATVIGEEMGCVVSDMGTGQWTTNLEILSSRRESKLILGADGAVLQLPTETCVPGVDNPGGGVDSGSLDSGFSPDSVFSPDSSFPGVDTVPPPPVDSTSAPPSAHHN